MKLYRATGKEKYMDMAKYFLEERRVSHVVGQLIVVGERLPLRVPTQGAGDVHFLVHHIVPQRPAGLTEPFAWLTISSTGSGRRRTRSTASPDTRRWRLA